MTRKRCWWNSPKADVQFSVQRLHCPGVSSKAKDTENCRYTMQPTRKQLRLFRIIVSANQLSLCGAVGNMCEECESLHDRSRQPDVVMGQSIVLSEIKTEVPLENNDVVTPLVRGVVQVLHGDQVVELSVQLEVQEREEIGEDWERQTEVEDERGELKEKRTCTWMTSDETQT